MNWEAQEMIEDIIETGVRNGDKPEDIAEKIEEQFKDDEYNLLDVTHKIKKEREFWEAVNNGK